MNTGNLEYLENIAPSFSIDLFYNVRELMYEYCPLVYIACYLNRMRQFY